MARRAAHEARRQLSPPQGEAVPGAASTRGRTALFFLFAASGFAGLIYESIWTHYLKLFLGHAAYAQALVLGIFMGGMALGSWLSARFSGRCKNLLVAYAVTEAAIGVFALVFHETFTGATAVAYDAILPRLVGSAAAVTAFKWGLSALLILPQSILLGMTFPLMTAGVLRSFPDRPGRSLALLYFTNSLGAAVGVLASGFFLIRWVGLPGTVRLAGVLNLLVACEVWRRFRERAAGPTASATASGAASAVDGTFALFLGVSLVTGASSFIYEVAWIRMLSLVLGASTHAFEIMLSAFILGIALGSLWIQRRIDRLASPVRWLALLQLAMGLLALGTLPLYGSTFEAMRALVNAVPRTDGGYALFNLASNGIALAVMLPATFCAGTTLPLITHWLLRRGHGERSIGGVYAANTVGAILAVFFATHVGMTLLGLKGLLTFGAALDLALGVALAWHARADFARRSFPAAAAAVAAVAVAATILHGPLDPYRMASGVYRTGRLLDSEAEQVLFHRDGKTATVSVVANASTGQVRISTNGKVDAAVSMSPGRPAELDESTMILLGAVPMALHPTATTAACIGFGSGITTTTLLSNPRLASVDTVEIEEEIVRAAEHFRPRNELAYGDRRSHVHIDDAKTFFSTWGKRYDLLVSEPSNPWVSGVAGLFSDEFYRRARNHLSEGGLFVQWIQLYEIDPALVASVLKAIERNFDDYVVYASNDVDAVVVARNGAPLPEPDPSFMALPSLAAAWHRAGVHSPLDLAVRKIGDRRSWQGLTRAFDVPANSDFTPVLDQGAARARFLGVDAQNLLVFGREPLPVIEMLSPHPRDVRPTEVTRSPHFDGSRRAHEATLLREFVLRDRPDLVAAVPGDVFRKVEPLASWLRKCERPEIPPFPLASFLAVAQASLPDLAPDELAAMWWPLISGPCARRLDPATRSWVDFVAASSARDGARMASTSRLLLAAGHLAPQTTRYLVAAGMLGSILAGAPGDAARLWATYGVGLDIERDMLLRMLLARATAGLAGG